MKCGQDLTPYYRLIFNFYVSQRKKILRYTHNVVNQWRSHSPQIMGGLQRTSFHFSDTLTYLSTPYFLYISITLTAGMSAAEF